MAKSKSKPVRTSSPRSVKQLDLRPRRPVHPSPVDWRDQILYELMIDRFDDGRDHPPYDPKTTKRGRDPEQGVRFQGGTLRGITHRLDYLQGLGVTALWITPPLKNRPNDPGSYHGYGAQDFLSIDPRFGTAADLRQLVDQAHRRGIYILMDIVIDHAGDVWSYKDQADNIYDKTNKGRQFEFGRWRRNQGDDGSQAPLGPDDGLWPVELQHPEAFKRMGRMNDPNTPLPSEKGQAHHPLLGSVLDFALYRVAPEAIKGDAPSGPLRDRYDFLRRYYRDPTEAGKYYVIFLENHDQGEKAFARFLNNIQDDRLGVLGAGYLLTSLGIPCLYYGSEQGLDGGPPEGSYADDRYVRECLFGGQWGAFDTTGHAMFNPRHPIYQGIAALAKVRSQLAPLRYGDQFFREVSDDGQSFGYPQTGQYLLAYSRVLADQEVLVVLNLDPSARTQCISLDANLSPPGTRLTDALGNLGSVRVKQAADGRAFVRLKMPGRRMGIWRREE